MQNTVRIPKLFIFIKKDTDYTRKLMAFLKKNAASIRNNFVIEFISVSNESARRKLLNCGITTVPVIRFKSRWYVGFNKVIQFLKYYTAKPKASTVSNIEVDDYLKSEILRGVKCEGNKLSIPNNVEDEEEEKFNNMSISEKISRFQSRRPQMAGVNNQDKQLNGGQPLNNYKVVRREFKNDKEFIDQYKNEDNIYNQSMSDNILNPDDYILENYINESVNNIGQGHRGIRYVNDTNKLYKKK